MWKVAMIAFLILALLAYSSSVEQYQNFNGYYPGYGDPIYSGVTGDSAPYVNQNQQQQVEQQQYAQQPQQNYQQGGNQEYYQ
jgi:hypothetical protein